MRTGFCAVRREDVEDAAADRVFAHHLDRLAALVADAFQVRNYLIQRQFFADAQAQGKLPVEISGVDPQQRRGYRQNRDGYLLGRQPPEPDGALLADLGVRRQVLHGKHVQRRKQLRPAAVVGRQQVPEGLDRFRRASRPACCHPLQPSKDGRKTAPAAPDRRPWQWSSAPKPKPGRPKTLAAGHPESSDVWQGPERDLVRQGGSRRIEDRIYYICR